MYVDRIRKRCLRNSSGCRRSNNSKKRAETTVTRDRYCYDARYWRKAARTEKSGGIASRTTLHHWMQCQGMSQQ